jgi:hypothetical protein
MSLLVQLLVLIVYFALRWFRPFVALNVSAFDCGSSHCGSSHPVFPSRYAIVWLKRALRAEWTA